MNIPNEPYHRTEIIMTKAFGVPVTSFLVDTNVPSIRDYLLGECNGYEEDERIGINIPTGSTFAVTKISDLLNQITELLNREIKHEQHDF